MGRARTAARNTSPSRMVDALLRVLPRTEGSSGVKLPDDTPAEIVVHLKQRQGPSG